MTDTDSPPRIRPFADFLAEHNNGAGHNLAGEKLHELVAAVRDTGKKGSLTLTLSIEAMDEDTLVTVIDVATKVPKPPSKAAVFFVTDDGNLSRSDPKQTHLPLREVPGGVEVDEQALKDAK